MELKQGPRTLDLNDGSNRHVREGAELICVSVDHWFNVHGVNTVNVVLFILILPACTCWRKSEHDHSKYCDLQYGRLLCFLK